MPAFRRTAKESPNNFGGRLGRRTYAGQISNKGGGGGGGRPTYLAPTKLIGHHTAFPRKEWTPFQLYHGCTGRGGRLSEVEEEEDHFGPGRGLRSGHRGGGLLKKGDSGSSFPVCQISLCSQVEGVRRD